MNEPHTQMTNNREESAPPSPDAGVMYGQGLERMFLEYYGLNEQPFGVTPDPKFLYLGSKHREALTALAYGTESNRGLLTLVAQPGMGKTSILFQYLEQLRNKARV